LRFLEGVIECVSAWEGEFILQNPFVLENFRAVYFCSFKCEEIKECGPTNFTVFLFHSPKTAVQAARWISPLEGARQRDYFKSFTIRIYDYFSNSIYTQYMRISICTRCRIYALGL